MEDAAPRELDVSDLLTRLTVEIDDIVALIWRGATDGAVASADTSPALTEGA